MMNPYIKNLNRIEFLITLACTGHCKHCSEGEHKSSGEHIGGDLAVQTIRRVCRNYRIESIMTFGGEPLMHPDVVCKIHFAAKEMNIPKRQLITNGFFSKEVDKIRQTATKLAESGVNDVLLSVDAFHQETIPLETVKCFAKAVKNEKIRIRTHPAWLGGIDAENPYNFRTIELLKEFEAIGIDSSDGNIIFPSGNALKYLGSYFEMSKEYKNPYSENPNDVRSICLSPNGDVLGGNVCKTDIMDILESYNGKV